MLEALFQSGGSGRGVKPLRGEVLLQYEPYLPLKGPCGKDLVPTVAFLGGGGTTGRWGQVGTL